MEAGRVCSRDSQISNFQPMTQFIAEGTALRRTPELPDRLLVQSTSPAMNPDLALQSVQMLMGVSGHINDRTQRARGRARRPFNTADPRAADLT